MTAPRNSIFVFLALLAAACSDPADDAAAVLEDPAPATHRVATGAVTDPLPMLPQDPGRTRVFDCQSNAGAIRIVTRTGPGELAVWLPEPLGPRYQVIGQVRAPGGGRYGGDGVGVWIKGDTALLSVDGVEYPRCSLNRYASIWEHAKLSGVDFRAVGNEPGWHMEIRNGDRISFVYDYGDGELEAAAPEPQIDADMRHTEYFAGSLYVLITGKRCNDTMTGESFESRVLLRLDGREFHGCGRALH